MISELLELKDNEYKKFQSNLLPTIIKDNILGVRVPNLRKLVKKYYNTNQANEFINALPHKYYDENMLHSLLLSNITDYDECIKKIDVFLPYIDNWAVCDTLSPKIFKKNKDKLINEIKRWCKSKKIYECRFGIKMMMQHYLDDEFDKKYLEIPSRIKTNEYYLKMMIAWFFATALSKKWEYVIPYIENKKLDKWIHNKTIQKAKESYRISKEQKEYLNKLKV